MPPTNDDGEWDGPTAREMINSHTLAHEIITRHGQRQPVFDDNRIVELRRFIQNPSQAPEIMRELGITDVESAKQKGSLTGYIMATHGTEESVLTDDEFKSLKEWFDNGGGKTADEL